MRQKQWFLIFVFPLLCICHAESAIAKEDGNEEFLINSVATYKDSAKMSENAKDECGLERSLPLAIVKFAKKFKIKASLTEQEQVETAKTTPAVASASVSSSDNTTSNSPTPASLSPATSASIATSSIVSLEIEDLTAGRGGNGMGGRWVISELGVNVVLKRDGTADPVHKFFACSAGLGANPFANLRACDRLNRCTEQIGARTAKWLRSTGNESD